MILFLFSNKSVSYTPAPGPAQKVEGEVRGVEGWGGVRGVGVSRMETERRGILSGFHLILL